MCQRNLAGRDGIGSGSNAGSAVVRTVAVRRVLGQLAATKEDLWLISCKRFWREFAAFVGAITVRLVFAEAAGAPVIGFTRLAFGGIR